LHVERHHFQTARVTMINMIRWLFFLMAFPAAVAMLIWAMVWS
jgi:hypothetical protein